MTVMQRQQGLAWSEVGKMPILDFLHVLAISEANSKASGGASASGVGTRAEKAGMKLK